MRNQRPPRFCPGPACPHLLPLPPGAGAQAPARAAGSVRLFLGPWQQAHSSLLPPSDSKGEVQLFPSPLTRSFIFCLDQGLVPGPFSSGLVPAGLSSYGRQGALEGRAPALSPGLPGSAGPFLGCLGQPAGSWELSGSLPFACRGLGRRTWPAMSDGTSPAVLFCGSHGGAGPAQQFPSPPPPHIQTFPGRGGRVWTLNSPSLLFPLAKLFYWPRPGRFAYPERSLLRRPEPAPASCCLWRLQLSQARLTFLGQE